MKTVLLICFLSLTCMVNAQWAHIYTLPSPNYSLSFITVNDELYAGTSGSGVYKSQDNGASWEAANNGIFMGSAYVYSLASRNDSIYAGGFGEVSFSNNGGANWSLLNLDLWLNNFVYALIVKDNYLFAGVGHDTSNGVYRKDLNGSEWTQMNEGLPENVGVNAFAIQSNSLFAGTDSGVYASFDNGMNWTPALAGIGDTISVKALYHMNGNLLAGTPEGIFISSDQGFTWDDAGGLPEDVSVLSFSSNNSTVVAGAYYGAFISADNGLNWTEFNDGLENTNHFYSITSLGDDYYAGTNYGIWTTANITPTSVYDNDRPHDTWAVYPNPTSSRTVLELKYPVSNATLTVFNLQGQRIKRINNLSGQTIIFQRDNLPPGVYFIQLMQDDKVIATNKLVITDN